MGPIEVVIITFPDVGLIAGIAPLLDDLVVSGHVRVADALVVTRDDAGKMVVTDADDGAIPGWSDVSVNPQPLLSADDASLIVDDLEPGGAAVIVVLEHTWPGTLSRLAGDSGGSISFHARVDPQTVELASSVDA
jgi:hypothetical protein